MTEILIIRDGRVKDGEEASLVWKEFMDFHKRISAMDANTLPNARDMWIKYFARHVRSSIRKAIVAECNGRIVGFLLGTIERRPPIFTTPRQAYVDSIAVTKSRRNQGIGSVMLEAFEKWARKMKMPYIMLNVVAENEAAIHLYEERGFKTMVLAQRKLL